jgi:hypothetical protein
VGPDIAYYLGSNPKEAERISRLSALMQAKEIGKIESKLADNPPVKKSSNAPAPIAPVTARSSSGSPAYENTDPRSTPLGIELGSIRQLLLPLPLKTSPG